MIRRLALAALACALAHAATAGTYIAAESRDLRSAEASSRTHVLWLEGPNLRLEAEADEQSGIYRGDRDVVYWIDHRDKSYRPIDRASAEGLANGVSQANTAARRYIEMLPPAQREAARRMLDQTLGAPVAVSADLQVKTTGAKERIADLPCAVWEVRRGGARRAEVCRASFDAAKISDASRASVQALVATLRAVLPALAPEQLRQDGVDALQAFASLDGVPLRVRLFEDGKPVWETHVTRIEAREPPATAFALPDGYARKLPVPMGGSAQAAPAP